MISPIIQEKSNSGSDRSLDKPNGKLGSPIKATMI